MERIGDIAERLARRLIVDQAHPSPGKQDKGEQPKTEENPGDHRESPMSRKRDIPAIKSGG